MRVSRFYLPQALSLGATLRLDEDNAHYLRAVLRLKKGAGLTVFNGEGGEYAAVVTDIHKDAVSVELQAFAEREAESSLPTHLGLGIARGERMDLGVQKAVELGVSALTPLLTERCVVQLDAARLQQRLRHWQKIIQSACEQCGRNRPPRLHEPLRLEDWTLQQTGLRLFLHPHGGKRLSELAPPVEGVTLLAGPEGGFAERERTLALEAGFIPLRLGPRILRTETAALAALAAIQAIWGDLGL
jgi:16S rRNA (uracil1498-N3)-methyltransferase